MAEARGQATTVLEVSGVQWATEKNVAEVVLSRRLGVLAVEANPVAQTATVTYDPDQTSVAEPTAHAVHDHGPANGDPGHDHSAATTQAHRTTDAHHAHHAPEAATPAAAQADHAGHAAAGPLTAQEAMGHGGHHAG